MSFKISNRRMSVLRTDKMFLFFIFFFPFKTPTKIINKIYYYYYCYFIVRLLKSNKTVLIITRFTNRSRKRHVAFIFSRAIYQMKTVLCQRNIFHTETASPIMNSVRCHPGMIMILHFFHSRTRYEFD